jgi:hypothetical protein
MGRAPLTPIKLLRETSAKCEAAGALGYSELLLRACIEVQGIDHQQRAQAAQALAVETDKLEH